MTQYRLAKLSKTIPSMYAYVLTQGKKEKFGQKKILNRNKILRVRGRLVDSDRAREPHPLRSGRVALFPTDAERVSRTRFVLVGLRFLQRTVLLALPVQLLDRFLRN